MKKVVSTLVALAVLAAFPALPAAAERRGEPASAPRKLERLRYFVDTHDRASKTFPERITKEEFAAFAAAYEQACREEGVVVLRVHVNLVAGRAWCLTAAPDAEAVRRAHERVGLPYDGVTEVVTVTPGDMFP